MLSDQAKGCLPYSQAMSQTVEIVSQKQARRAILSAQRLLTLPKSSESLAAAVDHLGAVQLDTISVLARSHELVAHARHLGLDRATIEKTYWDGTSHFEYWSHAACILPIDRWPLFSFRRKAARSNDVWNGVTKKTINQVKHRLASEGGLTTTELGGGRKSSDWWDWSETKSTVEWLLNVGEVTCTKRIGWRRVYQLSEDAIPAKHFHDLPDEEAIFQLMLDATRSLGLGTMNDILDVHRLKKPKLTGKISKSDALSNAWQRFISHSEIVQIEIPGWSEIYFGFRNVLDNLSKHRPNNAVLLSPFDSLVWNRPRLAEVFEMEYRIEAYTPKAQRIYGYFAMPVLVGDEIVARVDPKRNGSTLTINKVVFQFAKPSDADVTGVATAIKRAASWVNCNQIEILEVIPKPITKKLTQLVS